MKVFRFRAEFFRFILVCALWAAGGAETSEEMPTNSDAGGRIVGGSDVTSLGTLPWQGLLLTSTGYLCGCSLISAEWALTAAHCTDGLTASQLTLYFGMLDRSDVSLAQQTFSVAAIVPHASYDNVTTRYDISLLQLASPATLDANVAAIALPTQGGAVADGISCTISGWGTLSSGGSLPAVLQQATVPIVSQAQCQTWFSAFTTQVVYSDVVCAGYEAGGVDTCQGDSGGPMACYDSATSAYVLHGITSYGFGCADAASPGVYTRVSEFVDWILVNTGAVTTTTAAETTAATTTTAAETTAATTTTAAETTAATTTTAAETTAATTTTAAETTAATTTTVAAIVSSSAKTGIHFSLLLFSNILLITCL